MSGGIPVLAQVPNGKSVQDTVSILNTLSVTDVLSQLLCCVLVCFSMHFVPGLLITELETIILRLYVMLS